MLVVKEDRDIRKERVEDVREKEKEEEEEEDKESKGRTNSSRYVDS